MEVGGLRGVVCEKHPNAVYMKNREGILICGTCQFSMSEVVDVCEKHGHAVYLLVPEGNRVCGTCLFENPEVIDGVEFPALEEMPGSSGEAG